MNVIDECIEYLKNVNQHFHVLIFLIDPLILFKIGEELYKNRKKKKKKQNSKLVDQYTFNMMIELFTAFK